MFAKEKIDNDGDEEKEEEDEEEEEEDDGEKWRPDSLADKARPSYREPLPLRGIRNPNSNLCSYPCVQAFLRDSYPF